MSVNDGRVSRVSSNHLVVRGHSERQVITHPISFAHEYPLLFSTYTACRVSVVVVVTSDKAQCHATYIPESSSDLRLSFTLMDRAPFQFASLGDFILTNFIVVGMNIRDRPTPSRKENPSL